MSINFMISYLLFFATLNLALSIIWFLEQMPAHSYDSNYRDVSWFIFLKIIIFYNNSNKKSVVYCQAMQLSTMQKVKIFLEALEIVMCDVIKIHLEGRIATRSGKANQPLNIKTALELPILKLGLPAFSLSVYIILLVVASLLCRRIFMMSYMTFSSASFFRMVIFSWGYISQGWGGRGWLAGWYNIL